MTAVSECAAERAVKGEQLSEYFELVGGRRVLTWTHPASAKLTVHKTHLQRMQGWSFFSSADHGTGGPYPPGNKLPQTAGGTPFAGITTANQGDFWLSYAFQARRR